MRPVLVLTPEKIILAIFLGTLGILSDIFLYAYF